MFKKYDEEKLMLYTAMAKIILIFIFFGCFVVSLYSFN